MKSTEYTKSGDDEIINLYRVVSYPSAAEEAGRCWSTGDDKETHRRFPTPSSNVVASWAIQHFAKHGKPLGLKGAQIRLWEWSARQKNKELISGVESRLSRIEDLKNANGRGENADAVRDGVRLYLNGQAAEKMFRRGAELCQQGRFEEADRLAVSYASVEAASSTGSLVLGDKTRLHSYLTAEDDPPLFTYPGDLGVLTEDVFYRGAFVALLGSDKVGKSHWLLDIAFRCIENGHRVAYFECGDNGEYGVFSRLLTRINNWPSDRRKRFPCEVNYPTNLESDADGTDVSVSFRKRRWEKRRSVSKTEATWDAYVGKYGDNFFLSAHANSTLSVRGIDSILQAQALKGWKADAIIIDYADILAKPPGRMEPRDQHNENWQQLRRLSQQRHALVVTASQSNAAVYKKMEQKRRPLMGPENFSEDKRKHSHVTAEIGLLQTHDDRRRGFTAVNLFYLRDGDCNKDRWVPVAGCLGLSQPVVCTGQLLMA